MAVLAGKNISREILDLMGFPKYLKKFMVEASVDSIVTVTCEFYLEPPQLDKEKEELLREIKKYKLVEIEEKEAENSHD